MNSEAQQAALYSIGDKVFSARNADTELSKALKELFPYSSETDATVHNLEEAKDIRSLICEILTLYPNCIWIDAACLISPGGKHVLISGNSGTGKSTTAMALVLGFDWKLLSEDITLIESDHQEIISFPSPFSLKPGTESLVKNSTGIEPGPVVQKEWIAVPNEQVAPSCPARFDIVVHYGGQTVKTPLTSQPISPAGYVRKILECSNLIHMDEAPDQIVKYISSASRHLVTGGSLEDRIEFFLGLDKRN